MRIESALRHQTDAAPLFLFIALGLLSVRAANA
jgi:hypothetical protein